MGVGGHFLATKGEFTTAPNQRAELEEKSMAKLKIFSALPDYGYQADLFNAANAPTTANGTTFVFTNGDGDTITLTGSSFKYDAGTPIGGVVASMVIKNGSSQTLVQVTNASVQLDDLYALLYGYDRENNPHQDPDPFNAFSLFFSGNDTIIGSSHSDDLIAGRSLGNDTINAKGGDDFIHGDAGNDKINGGGGHDTLSYSNSFYDPTATHGIKLDVGKGTVTDPWGGHDTFKNVERFEGSKFADNMKGSGADEEFAGSRGNDHINGKGGFDVAYYDQDGQRGGIKGIQADLSTGKIKDGWHNTDTVKNIEGVVGTNQANSFVGDGHDNMFVGLDGVNSFDGKGGFDFVNFWGDGIGAVSVDLQIAGAEIQDDGFGHIEQASHIEGIGGSDDGDTILGNGVHNELIGNGGGDVLNGRGGNDYLEGDGGADQFNFELAGSADSDVIGDFNPGEDLIGLSIASFNLTGSVGDNIELEPVPRRQRRDERHPAHHLQRQQRQAVL